MGWIQSQQSCGSWSSSPERAWRTRGQSYWRLSGRWGRRCDASLSHCRLFIAVLCALIFDSESFCHTCSLFSAAGRLLSGAALGLSELGLVFRLFAEFIVSFFWWGLFPLCCPDWFVFFFSSLQCLCCPGCFHQTLVKSTSKELTSGKMSSAVIKSS